MTQDKDVFVFGWDGADGLHSEYSRHQHNWHGYVGQNESMINRAGGWTWRHWGFKKNSLQPLDVMGCWVVLGRWGGGDFVVSGALGVFSL